MFGKEKMKIIFRNISELIPAEYNPRKITDKELNDLVDSFKSIGTLEPAVINMHPDRLNTIISGHQRIKAFKSMGNTEYPCYEVSMTYEKEREANVRMNKNTGDWDFELLGSEFEKDELEAWGFDSEIDDIFGGDGGEGAGEIQFSEELDEESNYIVLKFNKDIDFLNIQTILDIKSTYSKRQNGKPWSKGVGRVVDGVDAIIKFKQS